MLVYKCVHDLNVDYAQKVYTMVVEERIRVTAGVIAKLDLAPVFENAFEKGEYAIAQFEDIKTIDVRRIRCQLEHCDRTVAP